MKTEISILIDESEERYAARVGMVKTEDFQSSKAGSLPAGSTKIMKNWFKNINCATIDVAGRAMTRLSLFQ